MHMIYDSGQLCFKFLQSHSVLYNNIYDSSRDFVLAKHYNITNAYT